MQEAIASGVTASRTRAASSAWKLWVSFCTSLHLDPLLPSFQDKIPVLKIFAHCYRHSTISPSKRQVRARTVEDAVRQIAQTYSSLGFPDPRLNPFGDLDFRLLHQQNSTENLTRPPRVSSPSHVLQFSHRNYLCFSFHFYLPPNPILNVIVVVLVALPLFPCFVAFTPDRSEFAFTHY